MAKKAKKAEPTVKLLPPPEPLFAIYKDTPQAACLLVICGTFFESHGRDDLAMLLMDKALQVDNAQTEPVTSPA